MKYSKIKKNICVLYFGKEYHKLARDLCPMTWYEAVLCDFRHTTQMLIQEHLLTAHGEEREAVNAQSQLLPLYEQL